MYIKSSSASSGLGNNPPDPTPKEPDENSGSDLLDVELLPSSKPVPLFNYDESPSLATSIHVSDDELPLPGPSRDVQHASDIQSVASPPEAPAEEPSNTEQLPERSSRFKRWIWMWMKKIKPDRLPGKLQHSGLPDPHQPPMRANKGPSIVAEGQREKRTVTKSAARPRPKPPPKAVVPTPQNNNTPEPEDTSPSGQGGTDPTETSTVQQPSDGSEPSIGSVRIKHRPGSAKAIVSFGLPAWMLCFRSATIDGTD